ncbi:MAG: hypothetical protein FJZ95_07025, partial [Chloroflexi bacterium]|nr:hypothetical protein [Chloroflexota bacterium]
SDYSDRFLGGRGIAAKIYWDEVPPKMRAFDPENRIIFATGPLGGAPPFGGSRWTVCGKSAEKERFSYCNSGGRWGAELKFAGYDLAVIHGASEKPVYLLIDGEKIELKDASHVWGRGTIETRTLLKAEHGDSARVVAIGPAGENRAVMASFFAENDASGSGQLAASLGAKKMKAIVVKGAGKKVEIARPIEFKLLADHYRSLKIAFPAHDWRQISRWSKDLVLDFRAIPPEQMKPEPCYGCLGRCARQSYLAADGTRGKFLCHSAYFYQPEAERFYKEWNEVPFQATRLCDSYGLDTKAVDKVVSMLEECYNAGILTEASTGLPLSKIGSLEFIESLIASIALREGIGDTLAGGVEKAKKALLPAGTKLKGPGLLGNQAFFDPYGPRYPIMNAFPYAMEPTFPIAQLHEASMIVARWRTWTLGLSYLSTDAVREIAKKFWGSEAAADFTSYKGKALAAKMMQDRQYAKESLILCDFLWPMMQFEFTEDHVGDPTLESRILSAVVGKDIDEPGLRKIGERVFNLQRAILAREGHRGREDDRLDERCFTDPLEYDLSNPECVVPGKNGEVASRKGAVVDREKWEKMKDEYYALRGWDVTTGLQTGRKLEELGLNEIVRDLEKGHFVAT